MIGKVARPKWIHIVPALPKTRSGKIMRRVLPALSNAMETGDVTTLANPEIVDIIRYQIRDQMQGESTVVRGEVPEDVREFGAAE